MLVNNIIFLKKNFLDLYNQVMLFDLKRDNFDAILEDDNLIVNTNGKKIHVHSAKSNEYINELMLKQYNNIDSYEKILFVGTGIGHTVSYFSKKISNANIYIYEPSVEIFKLYANCSKLPAKKISNICVGTDENNIKKFINSIVSTNEKILIIELPTYKNFLSNEVNKFYNIYQSMVRERRSKIHTDYNFQKRWIANGLNNFFSLLNTPNILGVGKDCLKGKPLIIAASGPSLTDEIENLKIIKKEKLAYIFAVGSAINILVKNGVLPDATLSYDPGKTQHLNHDILRDNNITTVPLIYGSTVSKTTVNTFPGPKLHMITSQDTAAKNYLDVTNFNSIVDAPTIAAIALQLAIKLEMHPIIFTGQNLAYRDKKWYADGQRKGYEKLNENHARKNDILKVIDVYGNETNTTSKLLSFKKALEVIIKANNKIEYINTTKYGAEIEGTSFLELDELIKTRLTKSVAEHDWFKYYSEQKYDYVRINEKNVQLYESFKSFTVKLLDIETVLNKVTKLLSDNNIKQIERTFKLLDIAYNSFSSLTYYKNFIAPMNRVHYEKLVVDIANAKLEKNLRIRAKLIIDGYHLYLNICKLEHMKIKENMFKFITIVDKYVKTEAKRDRDKNN